MLLSILPCCINHHYIDMVYLTRQRRHNYLLGYSIGWWVAFDLRTLYLIYNESWGGNKLSLFSDDDENRMTSLGMLCNLYRWIIVIKSL